MYVLHVRILDKKESINNSQLIDEFTIPFVSSLVKNISCWHHCIHAHSSLPIHQAIKAQEVMQVWQHRPFLDVVLKTLKKWPLNGPINLHFVTT